MIILPSIETVVVFVPRTGSGSLKRAILDRYQDAMPIYRHMEADGVPAGYDRWRRVGVCRHPVDRLWSLYKFCQGGSSAAHSYKAYPDAWERLNRSVERSFSDWLVNNETVFSNGWCADSGATFTPLFCSLHSLPENRKSQFTYLRPDLGTEVFRFDEIDILAGELGVRMVDCANVTSRAPAPELDDAARDHIRRFFAWDLAFGGWSL